MSFTVNQFLRLVVLLALVYPLQVVRGQTNPESHKLMLYVEGGFTTFSMPDSKGTIDQIVNSFQTRYNVQAHALLRFPGNWHGGAFLRYRPEKSLWLLIGGDYTDSRGLVGYRDQYGTLSEDLNVHLVFLNAGLGLDFYRIGRVTAYGSVSAGLLIATLKIGEDISFKQFPASDVNDNAAYSGRFFAQEAALGVRTSLGMLECSVEGGYRFNFKDDKQDYHDNFGGWIFWGSVGVPIF